MWIYLIDLETLSEKIKTRLLQHINRWQMWEKNEILKDELVINKENVNDYITLIFCDISKKVNFSLVK